MHIWVDWVGMINPTYFSRSLKRICYGKRCLARMSELAYRSFILCTGIPQQMAGSQYGSDARISTVDDSCTSDKNSVNFGSVTPGFCRRASAGRATRWALPRISSFVFRDFVSSKILFWIVLFRVLSWQCFVSTGHTSSLYATVWIVTLHGRLFPLNSWQRERTMQLTWAVIPMTRHYLSPVRRQTLSV